MIFFFRQSILNNFKLHFESRQSEKVGTEKAQQEIALINYMSIQSLANSNPEGLVVSCQ